MQNACNSPLCIDCAKQSSDGLSYLFENENHNFKLGLDNIIIFWTKNHSEISDYFNNLLYSNPKDANYSSTIAKMLKTFKSAPKSAKIKSDQFFMIELEKVKNRIGIKKYIYENLENIIQNLNRYITIFDSKIISIYNIAKYISPNDKNYMQVILSDMFYMTINGGEWPIKYLQKVLDMIDKKSHKDGILRYDADILKIISAMTDNEWRINMDDVMESLGRMMMLCDDIQYQAYRPMGGNISRYMSEQYSSALSSTPRQILPQIIAKIEEYLNMIDRYDKGKSYFWKKKFSETISRILPENVPQYASVYDKLKFWTAYNVAVKEKFDRREENKHKKESENE